MTEKAKTTHKLGEVVKAKKVIRPDGSEVDVIGGDYVLTHIGTYVIDGDEIHVK
jgi:hypothetical protein